MEFSKFVKHDMQFRLTFKDLDWEYAYTFKNNSLFLLTLHSNKDHYYWYSDIKWVGDRPNASLMEKAAEGEARAIKALKVLNEL